MATYLHGVEVPAMVQKAYELQYPNVAERLSLHDEIHRLLEPKELVGLVSGIKGKLFELKYLDYLNEGHLPDGYSAALASSAIQPGWDIAVSGPDGHLAHLIQLKATSSMDYVLRALVVYPQIDVVTTSEVYSHLLMQGATEHISNSGITVDELTKAVTDGFDAADLHMHYGPPVLALAIAAWSSYQKPDLTEFERCKRFGASGTTSWLAFLAGGTIAVATQTWWLSIVGSMGGRMILVEGQKKMSELQRLNALIAANQSVLDGMDNCAPGCAVMAATTESHG